MTTTVFLESVPDSWEAELRTSIFDMAGCFWVLRAGIGCLLLCCRGRRRIREARLQTTVALYRRDGRNRRVRVLLLVLHPTAFQRDRDRHQTGYLLVEVNMYWPCHVI